MTTKQKWIFFSIIAAIIAFVIWRRMNKKEDVVTESNEAEPVVLNEEKKVVSIFPLKKGSKGQEVFNVQAWLLRNEGAQMPIDGIWGDKTDDYVKRILKVSEISQDKYKSMGLK